MSRPLQGGLLGRGNFGYVRHSIMKVGDLSLDVAIKGANAENQATLKSEIEIMAHIPVHPNVLKILAVLNDFHGSKHLVLEYCKFGSLEDLMCKFVIKDSAHSYIPETIGDRIVLSVGHLSAIAYQIATGMSFLGANKLLHRDLATRNVLLNDSFLVKIADFGLTKQSADAYFASNIKPVPPEAAPECFTFNTFSHASDVFSFGVLLTSLFSLSTADSRQTAATARLQPQQLQQPTHASAFTWLLIQRCLETCPGKRPQFVDCVEHFKQETPEQLLRQLLEMLEDDLVSWNVTAAGLMSLSASSSAQLSNHLEIT